MQKYHIYRKTVIPIHIANVVQRQDIKLRYIVVVVVQAQYITYMVDGPNYFI